MKTLAFQLSLCPAPPNVYGTADYHVFRKALIKIDELLTNSGLEHDIVLRTLEQQVSTRKNPLSHK